MRYGEFLYFKSSFSLVGLNKEYTTLLLNVIYLSLLIFGLFEICEFGCLNCVIGHEFNGRGYEFCWVVLNLLDLCNWLFQFHKFDFL